MIDIKQYREQLDDTLQEQVYADLESLNVLFVQMDEMSSEDVNELVKLFVEYIEKMKDQKDNFIKEIRKYALRRSDFFNENVEAFQFIREVIQ